MQKYRTTRHAAEYETMIKKTARRIKRPFWIVKITAVFFLLIFLFLCFGRKNLNSSFQISRQWERETNLDNTVYVKWNIINDEIVMLVIGKTKSYVGIGFSFSNSMVNADIVIGGIANGVSFIQDCHATKNGRPILDKQQDCELIHAYQNDTHTEFSFRRKLNTCDDKDIKIAMDTVHLIWAVGNEDSVEGFAIDSFPYHGKKRGFNKVHLLDKQIPEPDTSETEYLDLTAENITVPIRQSKFYWWCSYKKIPNFGRKHHFIGFESIVTPGHEDIVHHILVFLCRPSETIKNLNDSNGHICFSPIQGSYLDVNCGKEFAGSAIGAKRKFYPEDMGIDFGSTDDEAMYVMLQIHYNLVNIEKDFQDSSGIRLFHTPNRRKLTVSTMNVMSYAMQILPPHDPELSHFGICAEKCTETIFPEDGIHVIGFHYHAHLTAKKMIFRQYRNGREIRRISDNHYEFGFQTLRFLKEEFTVLPRDVLSIECVYNTQNKTRATITGLDSHDEMCLLILLHYPPIQSDICYSIIEPEELNFMLSGVPTLKPSIPFYQMLNLYQTYINYLIAKYRSWTEEESKMVKEIYMSGNYISRCNNEELLPKTSSKINFKNFSREEDDICNT